ncbi:MAG: hypothetical protein RLZZ631_792 [Cyanobacteriota bacterium]|jgi:hypothetical protein
MACSAAASKIDLLRLLGAAASHGLLTGQIVFSAVFVGACELPNWIHAPRQVNACLERWMTVSALFFPSGMHCLGHPRDSALGAGPAGDRPDHRPQGLGNLQLLICPVGGEGSQQADAVAVDAEHGVG